MYFTHTHTECMFNYWSVHASCLGRFIMEAGCSKAPMIPAVLRWEIKGILCFY